ncbi:MAG: adenylyl-sulfate kinase [Spirochaetaceae bacterium]|nr:MAG: adenylyl-sulfate kinase [Spirochaetaceae bacterium]
MAKSSELHAARGSDTAGVVDPSPRELLRFTTAGSVDDGKSTLIGRLLLDSHAVHDDQIDGLRRAASLRGETEMDLALITDGLKAEREQRITIDVAYRYFSTARRSFIIADTPGHEQYTRNMVTGASTADLAIILVDARSGVLPQSRRHGLIASLLGIQHLVVAVNKMDLVEFAQEVFDSVVVEYTEFSSRLDIHDVTFIPVSALHGDNVVTRSARTPWYDGPSILHHLETVTISADRNLVDFRFPVQTVIRPHQDFRGLAGTVISGTIKPGEAVVALPSAIETRVKRVSTHAGALDEAVAGQAVVIELEDQIDAGRGDMIVRAHNVPTVARELEAMLCWMDDERPLSTSTGYILQHGPRAVRARVTDVLYRIDVETLHRVTVDTLRLNEIGRVAITASAPIFYDAYHDNRANGGFVLIDPTTHRTVAAGMLRHASDATASRGAPFDRDAGAGAAGAPGVGPAPDAPVAVRRGRSGAVSPNVVWEPDVVDRDAREARNAHAASVIWFTGLSGSGKSTLARGIESQLFDDGRQVIRLDGDNVRHGLCGDLGFSEADREENIRRVAEVAKLFFEAGQIVLCSFISPYARDRAFARSLIPAGRFIEVYVRCDVEECSRRDPKGLYARARAGELSGLTGVDAPYEEPAAPELVVDTALTSVVECLAAIRTAIDRVR